MLLKYSLAIFYLINWPASLSAEFLFRLLSYDYIIQHPDEFWRNLLFEAKYQQEKVMQQMYPPVELLNEYIGPLVSKKKCIIILDNFQRVDFAEQIVPIILRRPLPFAFYSQEDRVYTPIWGPELGVNISRKSDFTSACPLSKFLANPEPHVYCACLRIDLSKYPSKAKPWNCEVHLSLFPPVRYPSYQYEMEYRHPVLFQQHSQYSTPSLIPSLTIFVFYNDPEHIIPAVDFRLLATWVGSAIESHSLKSLYAHAAFFVITIRPPIFTCPLAQNYGEIETFEVLRVCPGCFRDNQQSIFTRLKFKAWLIANFTFVESIAFPDPKDNLMWILYATANMNDELVETLWYKVLMQINSCRMTHAVTNFVSSNGTANSTIDEELDILVMAYAHMWCSVMKNYTIRVYGRQEYCVNGVSSSIEVLHDFVNEERKFTIEMIQSMYVTGLFFHPYFSQRNLKHLKFISCGRRGLDPIDFDSLVNIYDDWIWMWTIISIFATVTTLGFLSSKVSYMGLLTHLTSQIRILLEQGLDSDAEAILTRNRYVIAASFLGGIVLSNAYKNSNVYEMILPRKPLAYKTFNELIQDNFTIYSRSYVITLGGGSTSKHEKFEINANNEYGTNTFITGKHFHGHIITEAELEFEYLNNWGRRHKEAKVTSIISKSALVKFGVRSGAKLSPFLLRIINEIITNELGLVYRKSLRVKDSDKFRQNYYDQLKKSLTVRELVALFNFLKDCNKAALILPERICKKFSRALKRQGVKNVFIGKESYIETNWIPTLRGLVPPFLVRRVKSLGESGIWERWTSLLNDGMSNTLESIPVTPASMEGNVLVIFTLWVTGIGVAAVVFVAPEVLAYRATFVFTSRKLLFHKIIHSPSLV